MIALTAIPETTQADEAFLLDTRIRQRKERIEENFIALGQDLQQMRDQGLYRLLDFETFEAYLASPERAIKKSQAYKLIRAAECAVRLHVPPEAAGIIGVERLDVIRRPVMEFGGTPEEWLAKASQLAVTDLREEAEEFLARQGAPEPRRLTVEDEDEAQNRQVARAVLEILDADRCVFKKFGTLEIRKGRKTIKIHASGKPLTVTVEVLS